MKAAFRRPVVCVLALFFSLGCADLGQDVPHESSAPTDGSVAMNLDTGSIPSEVSRIVACLSRENAPPICQSVNVSEFTDSIHMAFEHILAGIWDLTVSARDKEDRERFSGQAKVEVRQQQTTHVWIVLDAVSATGRIEIQVFWGVVRGPWTMDPQNPILKQSVSDGDGQFYYIQDSWILKVNGIYRMWYTTGTNDRQWIAHATSLDGRRWTKSGIVLDGSLPGTWSEAGVSNPAVLAENGMYHMWFNGKTSANPHNGIGYASSLDGIHWDIHSAPVIAPSDLYPQVFCPAVLRVGESFLLYYSVGTLSSRQPLYEIHMRAGRDPRTLGPEVKIYPGNVGLWWQSGGVYSPHLLIEGSLYIMYFTSAAAGRLYIGKAVSEDGVRWHQTQDIPEVAPWSTGSWRTAMVGFPHVMRDEGRLKLWFSALSIVDQKWQIGYAEQ